MDINNPFDRNDIRCLWYEVAISIKQDPEEFIKQQIKAIENAIPLTLEEHFEKVFGYKPNLSDSGELLI